MPKRRITYLQKFEAMELWLTGTRFRNLAIRYGVSVNTIRQWHYRNHWSEARKELARRIAEKFWLAKQKMMQESMEKAAKKWQKIDKSV